jgi:hypothetical protein
MLRIKPFLCAAALLLGLPLFAGDATGKWSGTFTVSTPNGDHDSGTALLILKQAGTVVTGTAGPNSERQSEIKDGKIDGDQVQFRVPVEDAIASVQLRLDGDQMKGQLTVDTPDGKVTGKLELKRVP